jgi:hypothetical protein
LVEHWQRRPKIESYTAYILRIRKTKGKGRAEDCKGYITVEGTHISVPSVWEGAGDYGSRSIDKEDDLKLFNVSQDQKSLIIFSNPNNFDKSTEVHHPYTDEILDKELSVTIATSNANVPQQPYTKTIREIIETAKSM